MRIAKIIGVTILGMLTLSGVMVADVWGANPEFLGVLPAAFTTTGGGALAFTTLSGATFSCTSSAGSGSLTSPKVGTFDKLLLGCSTKILGSTVKCTGLNDKVEGSILVKGTYRLAYAAGTGTAVLVLTFEEIHYECSIALVLVRGCLLGVFTPTNKKTKTATETFKQKGGDQELTSYEEAKGDKKPIKCELELSLSLNKEHKFEMAAFEGTTTVTFKEEIEIMA